MFCFATRKDEDRWDIGDLPSLLGAAWKKEKEGEGDGEGRVCLSRCSVIACLSFLQWRGVAICGTSVLPESIIRHCPAARRWGCESANRMLAV